MNADSSLLVPQKKAEKDYPVLKSALMLLAAIRGMFAVFVFSAGRLALLGICVIGIFIFLTLALIYSVPALKSIRTKTERVLRRPAPAFFILTGCWTLLLISACLLLAWTFWDMQANPLFGILLSRAWGMLVWGVWLGLLAFVFFSLFPGLLRSVFSPFRAAVFFTITMLAFFAFSAAYRQVNRLYDLGSLSELAGIILLPCLISLIWAGCYRVYAGKRWAASANMGLLCLLIGTATFMVYRMTGFWMNHWDTHEFTYWHQLAEAFLHGRLYLTEPDTLHDLTFYKGHWYVPNPPLPAILLMPFVGLLGVERINMTVVSAILGALNTVAVFLMLQRASARSLTNCGLAANLWLTAVFAFGTNHIWIATTGQIWFVSQLVTTLFVTLACLAAIENWPAWIAGLFLGLAILARPNVFPIAIFLAGIFLWRQAEFPEIRWQALFSWAVKAAVPVIVAVGILLGYNHLRFENWFDFGYVTIRGADWILEAVQEYGMFHPHFIPINLDAMFFRVPALDFSGERFFFQPDGIGFSIFVMTPPLIFLFRHLRKNWWTVAAWFSILLTTGLLLCYHNTGATQVGYRYLLDMIPPVLLLMGIGIGKRPGTVFKTLSGIAFLVNALSVYWWYIGRMET